jgi:hypothetical protein
LTLPRYDADFPGRWTATVEINGDRYDLEHVQAADDDTGHCWDIYDVRKWGPEPKHHRLTAGPDGFRCDCEWSTYKPDAKPCRHRRALPVLLGWLEQHEQLLWEARRAVDALAGHDADVSVSF